MKKIDLNTLNFLRESNAIEREYSDVAFEDSISAWKYTFLNRDKLNVYRILEIHAKLMKRLRPDIAGRLRNCAVTIGGKLKKDLGNEFLICRLTDICQETDNFTKQMSEEEIKKYHVEFEEIHPFEDGNGRTGRILYNIHRINNNLPIHVILDKDKREYYRWFRN